MKRVRVSSLVLCMLFSLIFASQAAAYMIGSDTSGYTAWSWPWNEKSHELSGRDIRTKYNYQNGVSARFGGNVTVNGGSITTLGNYSAGLYAKGFRINFLDYTRISYASINDGWIRTYGKEAHGAQASEYGVVSLRNVDIVTSGAKADAIRADEGKVYMDGGSLSADSSRGSFAINAYGDKPEKAGYVKLSEAAYTITGDVRAAGRYGTVDMALGDGSLITGDISAECNGAVNMSLSGNSLFTGKTASFGASNINIALKGEDAKWIMTGDSRLSKLAVDGGVVDMTQTPGSDIYTLELTDGVNGGGTFIMDATTPEKSGNNIAIAGNANGSHTLKVNNDGGALATGKETITLVELKDDQTADFALTHTVELGGWQYEIRRTAGAATRIQSGGVFELYSRGRASNTASAAVNSFAGSYMLGYAEMQTLYQRLGELRHSTRPGGFWARVYGGEFESDAGKYAHAFDMDYGGVQIGFDSKVENDWNGALHAGIMFGCGRGVLDYIGSKGNGKVDSKTLGVYGTYIGNDGWYVDALVRYQWTDNEFDVIDTAGLKVKGGDIDMGGFGASVEVGKRVYAGERKADEKADCKTAKAAGWYVEPQAQISYQRLNGGYFNASNNLRVGVDSFSSLLGRLGVLVGYETNVTNFYGKISRVKEFDGDMDIRANGATVRESLGGSWWVFGLGVTSKIGDRNNIYVDVERTSGGSFKQPWKVNLGWRMEI